MAINKPVKKGTKQRFSQTENITAGVGDYGNKKSFNLTKKQLGAKGAKAAASDKIAISRTRYDSNTKKVYGPKGQPITGRVDMGGGNIAVYKNGVRVTAKKAAASKPKGGNGGAGGGAGGGGGKGGGGGRKMIDRGPLMQADRKPRPKPAGDSGTNRGPLLQGERKPRPTPAQAAIKANSGYVRGIGMTKAQYDKIGKNYVTREGTRGGSLSKKLVEQRNADTKNQYKDAAAIAGYVGSIAALPLLGGAGAAGAGARGLAALGGRAAPRAIAGRAAPRAIKGSPPKAIEARATTGGAKISYGRPGIQKTPTGREVRGLTERGGATARPGTTKPMTAAQKRAATRKANAAKKKG